MVPHTFPAYFLEGDLPPCWLQPASFYLCCFPLTSVQVVFGVLSMLLLLSHNLLWLAPVTLWKQQLNQTGASLCVVVALPRTLMAPPRSGLLRVIFLLFVLLTNVFQLPREREMRSLQVQGLCLASSDVVVFADKLCSRGAVLWPHGRV